MHVELAEVTTVVRGGTSTVLRVTVTGDIDHTTAPALRQVLAGAVTVEAGRLELDLTGVTFFSCAGLTALVGVRDAAGDRLRLVGAARPVRRVLQLVNLDAAFGTTDGQGPT